MTVITRLLARAAGAVTDRVCAAEYRRQSFGGLNERPVEYAFLFRQVARRCPRAVLDVGSGATALPQLLRQCGPLVTAVDNIVDFWPSGMTNRHYHVVHDDITRTRLTGSFDLISCVSVLEHVRDHGSAVRNMVGLLAADGILVLTFPYTEAAYVANVYALPGSDAYGKRVPYVTQSFSRDEVTAWCRDAGAQIVEQEYWQCYAGGCWSVGEQVLPPRRVSAGEPHQLSCLALRRSAAAGRGRV